MGLNNRLLLTWAVDWAPSRIVWLLITWVWVWEWKHLVRPMGLNNRLLLTWAVDWAPSCIVFSRPHKHAKCWKTWPAKLLRPRAVKARGLFEIFTNNFKIPWFKTLILKINLPWPHKHTCHNSMKTSWTYPGLHSNRFHGWKRTEEKFVFVDKLKRFLNFKSTNFSVKFEPWNETSMTKPKFPSGLVYYLY